MTLPRLHTALMAALPVAQGAKGDGAPEWIHLLPNPAGGQIQTGDKRGPYTVGDLTQIIALSFAESDALEIDINHATYLAAPRGERADAVGWVREMQARSDGIWGRVEWTDDGAALVTGRAYRAISPVVIHDDNKNIIRLANASLVNRPNLRGLVALHAEEHDMVPKWLLNMLGLADDATEEQAKAALKSKMGGKGETAAAQAQLVEIGAALGVSDGSDAAAILTAAKDAASDGKTLVPALQAQVNELGVKLKALTDGNTRTRAENFIDGQITAKRMGLNSGNREEFVAMHMENPERTEKLVTGFAQMTASGMTVTPPATKDGTVALNAEQLQVAEQLGMSAKDFTSELKAQTEGEDA